MLSWIITVKTFFTWASVHSDSSTTCFMLLLPSSLLLTSYNSWRSNSQPIPSTPTETWSDITSSTYTKVNARLKSSFWCIVFVPYLLIWWEELSRSSLWLSSSWSSTVLAISLSTPVHPSTNSSKKRHNRLAYWTVDTRRSQDGSMIMLIEIPMQAKHSRRLLNNDHYRTIV